jgi:phytoene dehydrogenase-like protein
MLGWLLYEHGIEPQVTVFDKPTRTGGTFSREDFTYDHAGDVYRCPAGKVLVNDGADALRRQQARLRSMRPQVRVLARFFNGIGQKQILVGFLT